MEDFEPPKLPICGPQDIAQVCCSKTLVAYSDIRNDLSASSYDGILLHLNFDINFLFHRKGVKIMKVLASNRY